MSNNQLIAIYARVSSDKQANERTIDSQLCAVREFASGEGVPVDQDLTFIDNGISGATLRRPALDNLRDRAAAGEIDRILVHTPDRLARKYAHQLILIEEFHRLGVEILFVNRNITASPEDQLLLQIQGVISEYEREKIMERSRRGKLYKARQGKVSALSAAPYGYIYIPATDQDDARFEIIERESQVVKKIFHMLVNQGVSLNGIARSLTKERIPTRNNVGHWEKATVWTILKNPAYIGKAAYGKTQSVERARPTKRARDGNFYPKHVRSSVKAQPKTEWISIPVPAIIDEEIFNKVQQQLEENKRLAPRNNKKYEYLLSGLLRCKECHYALHGRAVSKSAGKLKYYRCHGLDGHQLPNGRVCSGHHVRVEAIDDLVWGQIKRLLEEPDIVLKEYSSRVEHKQKQQSEYQVIASKKRKEIKQQLQEKERLLDLYQTGKVDLSEIEARLKSLRAKIKRLEEECRLVEKEEKDEAHQLQLIEQFGDFARRIGTNLAALSFEEKKKIVRLLVEEVIVDTKEEEITVQHILPVNNDVLLSKGGRLAVLSAGANAGDVWCARARVSAV